MEKSVTTKRNSQYPMIRLYDEVERLRGRDGYNGFDPVQFGTMLHTHFNESDVPHVAEAMNHLRSEGYEFQRPKRETHVSTFRKKLSGVMEMFKPAAEPAMPSELSAALFATDE